MRPAYRMARPGTLWIPPRVAAVSCHPVSPALSQLGPETMSRNIEPPLFSLAANDDKGNGQGRVPPVHRASDTMDTVDGSADAYGGHRLRLPARQSFQSLALQAIHHPASIPARPEALIEADRGLVPIH